MSGAQTALFMNLGSLRSVQITDVWPCNNTKWSLQPANPFIRLKLTLADLQLIRWICYFLKFPLQISVLSFNVFFHQTLSQDLQCCIILACSCCSQEQEYTITHSYTYKTSKALLAKKLMPSKWICARNQCNSDRTPIVSHWFFKHSRKVKMYVYAYFSPIFPAPFSPSHQTLHNSTRQIPSAVEYAGNLQHHSNTTTSL